MKLNKTKEIFFLLLIGILCFCISGCDLQPDDLVSTSPLSTYDITERPVEFATPEPVATPQEYDDSVVSGVCVQVRNDLQFVIDTERDAQSFDYIIKIHDETGNEVQRIVVENQYSPYPPGFGDLNFDGFRDILVPLGGIMNMTSQPYIWDNEKGEFVKVIFEGFEFLSYFEEREDHLAHWIKETGYSGTFMILVWDGNILRMESSEDYDNTAERERVLEENSQLS